MTKEAQHSSLDNLERVRKRSLLYDANFRKIVSHLIFEQATIYVPAESAKSE